MSIGIHKMNSYFGIFCAYELYQRSEWYNNVLFYLGEQLLTQDEIESFFYSNPKVFRKETRLLNKIMGEKR